MDRRSGLVERARALYSSLPTLFAGVMVAACVLPGQETPADLPGMAPTRLEAVRAAADAAPVFRTGESLTYDNPQRTWTVADRLDDGRIAWQADNGDTRITAANLILPPLQWRMTEAGAGKRLISNQSDGFFPLRAGKTVDFRDTAESDRAPFAWEYIWTCEVGRLNTTTVPAGTFPTYPIDCTRADGAIRSLHYAPELGAPVRIAEGDGSGAPETVRRLLRFERVMRVETTVTDTASADGAVSVADAAGARVPETGEGEDPPALAPVPSPDPVQQEAFGGATGPRPLGMIAETQGDGLQLSPAETPIQPAPDTVPSSGLEGSADRMASTESAETQAAPPGTIAVHLASYKNPDNAEDGWRALMAANRDQLGDTRPLIRRVDLGARGVFYRLHAGPLESRTRADSICRSLKQRGVYCAVSTL